MIPQSYHCSRDYFDLFILSALAESLYLIGHFVDSDSRLSTWLIY